MHLDHWIDQLQTAGRCSFVRTEALRGLQLTRPSLKKALQRASSRGRILPLRRDFYVIVPLEYVSVGAPPTEWFLNDLMRFLAEPYYIGCQSAAMMHGAAHQRPQETQVVVAAPIRNVEKSTVRVRFLRNASMKNALTETRRTQTGDVPISTPEWTAIDLIRFQKHYGGMDAAATVLTELVEVLDPERLAEATCHEPTSAYLQRLGWMLDFLGHDQIAAPMHERVLRRSPSFTPLNPSLKHRAGDRNSRWHVIVNEEPEADL